MSASQLVSEFQAANGRLTQKHFDHMTSLGFPSSCWFGAPSLVGLEFVETTDSNRYWPREHGNVHYVAPVLTGGPSGQLWDLLDLVVFKPSRPDQWWLRAGNGVLLGPDWPEWCVTLDNEPLYLHSTPLDWLRAGGQGSCIVDWSASLSLHLGSCADIICDTPELASRLHYALNKPTRPPNIHVAREAANVAA